MCVRHQAFKFIIKLLLLKYSAELDSNIFKIFHIETFDEKLCDLIFYKTLQERLICIAEQQQADFGVLPIAVP